MERQKERFGINLTAYKTRTVLRVVEKDQIEFIFMEFLNKRVRGIYADLQIK